MKSLLIIMVLAIVTLASAEVQIGIGTQCVQEIGTDVYFPLIMQAKLNVPVTGNFSVEARGIGETFKEGDASTPGHHIFRYSGLAGVGYDIQGVLTAVGGGIHRIDGENVPRAYYSMTFDLNWLQRMELIMTFDLDGEPQPMGFGFICSIGV